MKEKQLQDEVQCDENVWRHVTSREVWDDKQNIMWAIIQKIVTTILAG